MPALRTGCGILLAATVMVLGGCGGSSSPPISIRLSPSSSATIDQSQSVTISATVANDPSSKGVTWSLSGPGSLQPNASLTPNQSPAAYFSPTGIITAPQQATVTATSVADPKMIASLTVTINPSPLMDVTQTLPDGTVGSPYSQPVALSGHRRRGLQWRRQARPRRSQTHGRHGIHPPAAVIPSPSQKCQEASRKSKVIHTDSRPLIRQTDRRYLADFLVRIGILNL